MKFAEEQEQEERDDLYYVRLYNERDREARMFQHSLVARKTIRIASDMGIEADDDCFDIVHKILKKLDQVEEFLNLEE